MKFSICIPNYNYANYLPSTMESIIAQSYKDFEIVIADNASTDSSVEIIKQYVSKATVNFKVNATNLGFAGNLDSVMQLASGEYSIMLSSDDLMKENALEVYSNLIASIGSKSILITSAKEVIDSNGKLIRAEKYEDMPWGLWREADKDEELSKKIKAEVLRVPAAEMLQRMLTTWGNPFNFLATGYNRELHSLVGGYGSGRLINPDKWFHLRLLGKVNDVYFVNMALFQYRWHGSNQTALEARSGHLKFLLDEYRTMIEVPEELLKKANVTREKTTSNFVKSVIFRHGIGELSRGSWLKSFRIYCFGWAVFPSKMIYFAPYTFIYILFLILGPLGTLLARALRSK